MKNDIIQKFTSIRNKQKLSKFVKRFIEVTSRCPNVSTSVPTLTLINTTAINEFSEMQNILKKSRE